MTEDHRKTDAEPEHEWRDAKKRCWQEFESKLDAAQSLRDAGDVISQKPAPDTPGWKYFSNLEYFLAHLAIPMGSSYSENTFYLQLLHRMNTARDLKPEATEGIEQELRRVMESQDPSECPGGELIPAALNQRLRAAARSEPFALRFSSQSWWPLLMPGMKTLCSRAAFRTASLR